MALICILLGLALERVLAETRNLHALRWFDAYADWMVRHLPGLNSQGAATIFILLLPILLPVLLLQNALDGFAFDAPSFVFALLVFLYCLGASELDRDIDRYLDARENANDELAQKYGRAIAGKPVSAALDQQIADIMHGILYQATPRVFAVIFWFLILGPLGALMYRLTCRALTSREQSLHLAAKKFEAILAWAPVHLVAFGYALAGDFEGATHAYRVRPRQNDLSSCNYHVLITAGLGALRECRPGEETACLRSTRGLVLRTLILWLAVVALMTLAGWMA